MFVFVYISDAGSGLSSHDGGEMLSLDDELEIVSECWIEPVSGTVTTSTCELSHFSGSLYSHIPDVVSS